MNRVEWGMTRRRKRTEKEIARWDRRHKFAKEEEFFDYYDTVDWYGDPDEEVDKTGLSLQTRVHMKPDVIDRLYAHYRIQPGEYKITLRVGNKKLSRKSLILQDHWYDK